MSAITRIKDMLKQVGLERRANDLLRTFSRVECNND